MWCWDVGVVWDAIVGGIGVGMGLVCTWGGDAGLGCGCKCVVGMWEWIGDAIVGGIDMQVWVGLGWYACGVWMLIWGGDTGLGWGCKFGVRMWEETEGVASVFIGTRGDVVDVF